MFDGVESFSIILSQTKRFRSFYYSSLHYLEIRFVVLNIMHGQRLNHSQLQRDNLNYIHRFRYKHNRLLWRLCQWY